MLHVSPSYINTYSLISNIISVWIHMCHPVFLCVCRYAAAALRSLAGEGGADEDAAEIWFFRQRPIRWRTDSSPPGSTARPLWCGEWHLWLFIQFFCVACFPPQHLFLTWSYMQNFHFKKGMQLYNVFMLLLLSSRGILGVTKCPFFAIHLDIPLEKHV